MKKYLIILTLFWSSCKSSSEKTIEDYLEKNLDDWNSYQFVETKFVDTLFFDITNTSEYDSLSKIINYSKYEFEAFIRNTSDSAAAVIDSGYYDYMERISEGDYRKIPYVQEVLNSTIQKLDSLKKLYPPETYLIYQHKFRVKNDRGRIKLYNYEFTLDINDSIISVKNIDK